MALDALPSTTHRGKPSDSYREPVVGFSCIRESVKKLKKITPNLNDKATAFAISLEL